MGARTTVMFADLTGSTAVFEKLGNEAATRAITAWTDWIREVCQGEGGRVVKTLGDGVLAVFPGAADAVYAAVQLQREHARQQARLDPVHGMQLQVGLACGEIVEVGGDCYGDPVNVAARLSDLSGARQILAADAVVEQLHSSPPGTRCHPLGPMRIRGRQQECRVFRIDWQEDTSTDMMTLPAFESPSPPARQAVTPGGILLYCRGRIQEFRTSRLPVHIGRAREAEFTVPDPRVSRLHARIDWRDERLVLVDLSSNGTCVRFQGAPTVLTLRRDDCVLYDSGDIALGPDFARPAVPTVRFELRLR